MSWPSIVVGVDGSPQSVRAAALGATIARRAGTRCLLVCAVRDAVEAERFRVRASLRAHVPDDLAEAVEMRVGRAPLVLADMARETGAGLIVVGARPHRGIERLRGRLLDHLARTSDVPILVTDGATPDIARILVALDLSRASGPALAEAQRWARLFRAQLRAVHVIEPPPMLPFAGAKAQSSFVADYYRADKELRESGLWAAIRPGAVEQVVRDGDPTAEIISEVAQYRADLLVIGSRGRSWVDRRLLGSTTDELMDRPPVPTLVVPAGASSPVDGEPREAAGRA